MSNALQVLKNYDDKKFNVLVPVQTMQDFPDIYKLAINTVKISIEDDTYPQNGRKALNKIGLEKLMAAANIQILESKQVIPSTIRYAAEMAKQLGQPVEYDKRDIAYKVTISVPDLTGSMRIVTATKEMIAEEIYDECLTNATAKKKTPADANKEFSQIMKFRNALCESKALNRAIRKALNVKSTYTVTELNKPFAVPIVVPNTDDPEMKKAMVDRYRVGTGVLYNAEAEQDQAVLTAPQQDALQALDIPVIVEDEDVEDYNFEDMEEIEEEACCEDCGSVIESVTNKVTGETMSTENIINYSNTQFGQELCAKCISKREKERSK